MESHHLMNPFTDSKYYQQQSITSLSHRIVNCKSVFTQTVIEEMMPVKQMLAELLCWFLPGGVVLVFSISNHVSVYDIQSMVSVYHLI